MSSETLKAHLDRLEADNARLRALLDKRDAGADIRHQTRDTLSTVRALLRRSAETASSVEDYAAHLEGRLDALLRAQAMIMHHRAGIDLHLLLAGELGVFAADEDRQVLLSGPRIALQPKAAETLALAFHELATNAMKFGALSTGNGLVDVTWRTERAAEGVTILVLHWRESGVAAVSVPPSRHGFGRTVLGSMLNYELNAEAALDFAEAGLGYSIRLPLPPEVGTVVEGASPES